MECRYLRQNDLELENLLREISQTHATCFPYVEVKKKKTQCEHTVVITRGYERWGDRGRLDNGHQVSVRWKGEGPSVTHYSRETTIHNNLSYIL